MTGERRYLEMAKDFVDRRGTEPNYLIHESEKESWIDIFKDVNPFFPQYSQCHKPVRMQDTAEGHAVRAVYLYCAMADLAYEYQDEGLLHACEKLYDNIIKKRMYLTGGIGSSGAYERFTTDYDLPNDTNYADHRRRKICGDDGVCIDEYSDCRDRTGWKKFLLCKSAGSLAG